MALFHPDLRHLFQCGFETGRRKDDGTLRSVAASREADTK